MKNTILLTTACLLSAQSFSFESLVQDVDANETGIEAEFGTRSYETTFSAPGYSNTSESDLDDQSLSIKHALSVNNGNLITIQGSFSNVQSEGESQKDKSLLLGFITSNNDEAIGFGIDYTASDEGADNIFFGLSKELSFPANPSLDGQLDVGASLNENTTEVEGGNAYSVGLQLRSTLNSQLQLSGLLAVLMITDREFIEEELTHSYDPAFAFGLELSYAIVPDVYFGLQYFNSNTDGTLTDGTNSLATSSKLSAFSGSLKAFF
jgi:hypothetical protein